MDIFKQELSNFFENFLSFNLLYQNSSGASTRFQKHSDFVKASDWPVVKS